MKLSLRFIHVHVFAAFILGFTLMVGSDTNRATYLVEKFMSDWQELVSVTSRAGLALAQADFSDVSKSLYAAYQMRPSMVLEKVAEALEDVEKSLK